MKLTKGMFGSEFNRSKVEFAGLRCGQMRSNRKIAHNGGWYNKVGEKIGWGDLSIEDAISIKVALEPGEAFLILGESDSFWNFVSKVGIIGSLSETQPTIEFPGLDYCIKKARFAIFPGVVYCIDNPWEQFGALSRKELAKLL